MADDTNSGVLLEDIATQLSAVAEGVIAVNDKVDALDKKVDRMGKTLTIVKSDVELIKQELRQKVDLTDFQSLEKRVSALEATKQ